MDSNNHMHVLLGADHGGFALKKTVAEWLSRQGYTVQDLGALELDPHDDYPQYAIRVAEGVASRELAGERVLGILLCRSGGGMAIAANKVLGARAVCVDSPQAAVHAREHNNANILSLSADWIAPGSEQEIIKLFLTTDFSQAERHRRRIEQICDYETRR